jgi:predicted ArsR family transcriptional regulator
VQQLNMLEATPARSAPFVPSSATSAIAAERITRSSKHTRRMVLAYLVGQVCGCTDMEIAQALELLPDTARARRCELRDQGLIVASGVTRPSPSGRPAVVWIATDAARDELNRKEPRV